ncbi:MAG: hypothetical protein N2645_17765 [Clostridia bacterium]|nr:hypothetical protein [Clostridia bacterium]
MKMLRNPKRLLGLTLLLFLLMMQSSSVFAVSDPFSASMPKVDDIFDYTKNPNPYITTYKDNYSLDDTAGMFSPVEGALNSIADTMFQMQYFMAQLLVLMFWFVFNFNIFDVFKDLITSFLTEMKVGFFDSVVLILLTLTGAYFIKKKLQRRVIEFWIGLGIIVLVLAISTFYFQSPMKILNGVNNATNGFSQMILGTSDTPVVKASNDLWQVFVVKPWQNAEFGNPELAKKLTDEVLSKSDPDEREAIFEVLEATGEWENMGSKRCAYLVVMLVPMGITYIVLFAICLLSIGFQALMMIVFLLGPFVFALALIPEYGPGVLKKWGLFLISLAASKIVMVLVLKILTAFLKAMLSFGDTQGWGMVFIVQLIAFAMIFFFKKQIVEIFIITKKNVSNVYSLSNAGNSGSSGNSGRSSSTTRVSTSSSTVTSGGENVVPVSSKTYQVQRKEPVVLVDDEGNEKPDTLVTTFRVKKTKFKKQSLSTE